MFKLFGGKKYKKGSLGEEKSTLYYNEKLKRWVERGKEDEAEKEAELPPPPTTLNNSLSRQSIVSDPGPTSTGSVTHDVPSSGPPSVPGFRTSKTSSISNRYVAAGFNVSNSSRSAAPVNAFLPAAAAAKPPPTMFFTPTPVSSSAAAEPDASKSADEQKPPSNPYSSYYDRPVQETTPVDDASANEAQENGATRDYAGQVNEPEVDPEVEQQQPVGGDAEMSADPEQIYQEEPSALSALDELGAGADARPEASGNSATSDYTNAAEYGGYAGVEGGGSAVYGNGGWGGYEAGQSTEQAAESAYTQPATDDYATQAATVDYTTQTVTGNYSMEAVAADYSMQAVAADYTTQAAAADYSAYQFDWSQWGDYSTWTQEQIEYYNSYMAYYAAQAQPQAQAQTEAQAQSETQPTDATAASAQVEYTQPTQVEAVMETQPMSVDYASWQTEAPMDLAVAADESTSAWQTVTPTDGVAGQGLDAATDGWQLNEPAVADMHGEDVDILQQAGEEEEVVESGTPTHGGGFTDIPLDGGHATVTDKSMAQVDDDSASSHDGSAVSEQSSLPDSHSNHLFAPLDWIKQKTQKAGGKLVGMPWDSVKNVDYDEYWNETPDEFLQQQANGDATHYGSDGGLVVKGGLQSPEPTVVNAIHTTPPSKPADAFPLFSSPLFGSLQPAGNSLPKSVTPTSSVYASSPLLKPPKSTEGGTYESVAAAGQQAAVKGYGQPALPKDTTPSKDVSPSWGPPPPTAEPTPTPSHPLHPVTDNGYTDLSQPAAHFEAPDATVTDAGTLTGTDPTADPLQDAAPERPSTEQTDVTTAVDAVDAMAVVAAVERVAGETAVGLVTQEVSEVPAWPGPNGWDYVEGADYSKYYYWPDFTSWGEQSTWDAEKQQIYYEWYYGCQYFQYQQSQSQATSQAASQQGLSAEVSMEQVGLDTSGVAGDGVGVGDRVDVGEGEEHGVAAGSGDGVAAEVETVATAEVEVEDQADQMVGIAGVIAGVDHGERFNHTSQDASDTFDQGQAFDQISQGLHPGFDQHLYGPQMVGEPSTSRAGPPSHNSHNGDPGRMPAPERHTVADVAADDMDDGFTPDRPAAGGAVQKTDGWTDEDEFLEGLGIEDTGADGWHPSLPALAEQVPHVLTNEAEGSILSPLRSDRTAVHAAGTPQPPHTPPRDDHTVTPEYVDEELVAPAAQTETVDHDAAASVPTTSALPAAAVPAPYDGHDMAGAVAAAESAYHAYDAVTSLPSTSGASHTASLSNASTSATAAAGLPPAPSSHVKHHQHAFDQQPASAAAHDANQAGSSFFDQPALQTDGSVDFFNHLGEDDSTADTLPASNEPAEQAAYLADSITRVAEPAQEPAASSSFYDTPAAGLQPGSSGVSVHDASTRPSEEAEFFDQLVSDQDQANTMGAVDVSDAFQPTATPFGAAHAARVEDAAGSSGRHSAGKPSPQEAIDDAFNDPDAFFNGLLGMDSERESVGLPAPVTAADPSVDFFDQAEREAPQPQEPGQPQEHPVTDVPEVAGGADAGAVADAAYGHSVSHENAVLQGGASASASSTPVATHPSAHQPAVAPVQSTAASTTSGHTTPTTHAPTTTADTTPAGTPAAPSSPSHHAADSAHADDVASSSDTAGTVQPYLYDWSQNPRPDWSAWGPKESWGPDAHAMYADWVRWRKDQQKLRRKAAAKKAQKGATPVDSSATTPEHTATYATDTVPVTSTEATPRETVVEKGQEEVVAFNDQPGPSASTTPAAKDEMFAESDVTHTSLHETSQPETEAVAEEVTPVAEEVKHFTAEQEQPAAAMTPEPAAAVSDVTLQEVAEPVVKDADWAELAQELEEEDVWGAGVDAPVEGTDDVIAQHGPSSDVPEHDAAGVSDEAPGAAVADTADDATAGVSDEAPAFAVADTAGDATAGVSDEAPAFAVADTAGDATASEEALGSAVADAAGDASDGVDLSEELSARVDAYNQKLERFVEEREALVDEYLSLVDEGVEDIEMPDEKDNEGVQELLGNLGKASAQVELLLKLCRENGLDGEGLLRQNGLWE